VVGYVALIGSLAWPIAALAISLIYRQDVKLALARIGQVKYRNLEVSFRDDLRQAEALARSIPAKGRVVLEVESASVAELGGGIIGEFRPATVRPDVSDSLARLAAKSPRDAVLESWAIAGQALVRVATTLGDRRAPAPTRADDAARYLVDRGWLAGPEAQLVEQLRMIRDRVAHLDELAPSPDEARRFVDLALPLAARIEALG